jgi:hypothetical protein
MATKTSIKLVKQMKDEWTAQYVLANPTKYLKDVVFTGGGTRGYPFYCYDLEGKLVWFNVDGTDKHVPKCDSHKLSGLKEWISTFDETYEQIKAEYDAEQVANQVKYDLQKQAEKLACEEFKKPIESALPNVGDMLKINLSTWNKLNNFGEAVDHLQERPAKVVAVINVDNSTFDNFIDDCWSLKFDSELPAGSNSDAPELANVEMKDLYNDKNLMNIWHETCYELVQVVASPNRKHVIINTEGFDYARYIGFPV